MYDVLVVGAGPAGSTAARVLSGRGYRVLLVEKFKMPRYKSCSGVLIQKSVTLIGKYFGGSTPAEALCKPAGQRGMVFTDDRGRECRFEQPGLNVWRGPFDYWLASKAQESGAEIRDATTAVSCKKQPGFVTVTLHGETSVTVVEARYVLDCEGVVGAFKRKLVQGTPEWITTFQTFNEGRIALDPHYFYAYLQPELSEYDAWFNVKDQFLVLGVSVKNPKKIKDFYNRFLAYMGERHNLQIDRQIKVDRWMMPRIRPGCSIDYGQGRMLFAGEVAGFLNPMGEGISAAMESGCCAACAIADCFDDLEAIYSAYREAAEPLRMYMKRQWSLVAGMARPFQEMKGADCV